jgi:phosphocarrier protein
MIEREVVVTNQLGLHARAAAKFVHTASRFTSRVRVSRQHRHVDGKSIMGMLLLAASCGSAIVIRAEGSDEGAAVDALEALIRSGFGENPWNG